MKSKLMILFCLLQTLSLSSQVTDSLIFTQTYNKKYVDKNRSDSIEIVCDVSQTSDGYRYVEIFDYKPDGELTRYHFLIIKKIITINDSTFKYIISNNDNPLKVKWIIVNENYLDLKHKHNFLKTCLIKFLI